MGVVPSTTRPVETAEYLIGEFIGQKSFPLSSDFWQKLLELPLNLRWPPHRLHQACRLFAMNNSNTRHLAKILIHLALCLQECVSAPSAASPAIAKALNALFVSSVFLKYLIECSTNDSFEELYLSLGETETMPNKLSKGHNVESFIMYSVLTFIAKVDVSPRNYLLHHELLNFMLITFSTQLIYGPSPGPGDTHPFIDASMIQESYLVNLVARKLLLNYIARPQYPLKSSSYTIFSDGNQPGVLQRVGSAAANLMLLPFNYLVSSSSEVLRSPLTESSLSVLLVLCHYRKCMLVDIMKDKNDNSSEEETYFLDNPFYKALENLRDIEFDRIDIEGNAQSGPLVRISFASLFDTLGMSLADETSVLLLYLLLHGNSDFLEYVLVRTDLDTLLMPMLETLYNAPRKSSNHIYMVLIVFLILSQDSSFNASIHKLIIPNVPWFQERLLHQTSLGSLMVIILIRTVKYNLSKLKDVYLHTNCLATLANMAPHIHRLSAYASQRLVSLFVMLSRKYNKLADITNDKMMNTADGDSLPEDLTPELHIYTDFLRLVLDIVNAILTHALPRNPEVIYAIMHRQEVFLPFKNHPRFNEPLENIYTVLDFFNIRVDAQKVDGEWSVEKVLEVIINICRSWRGEGMNMFTQLRFTYEQEKHPEEFFNPYVWQLVLSYSGFKFNPTSINLFAVPLEDKSGEQVLEKLQNIELREHEFQVETLV